MFRAKELRIQKKLKQIEVSEYLKINRATYSKQEAEINPMPSNLIIKLANFFNVTTDYLLGISDLKFVISNKDCETLKNATEKQKQLIDMILDLRSDQLSEVKGYILGVTNTNKDISKNF